MVSTSHDIDMTSASDDRLMVLSGDDEAKEDCASELSISNIVICDTNNDVIVTNFESSYFCLSPLYLYFLN